MYLTGDDVYQKIVVFSPVFNLQTLDSNKEATNWISTGISLGKIRPFDLTLAPTMPNVANGRVSLKFNNSVLVQQSSFSLCSNFILNLSIVYELINWSHNQNNDFAIKDCLFGTVI